MSSGSKNSTPKSIRNASNHYAENLNEKPRGVSSERHGGEGGNDFARVGAVKTFAEDTSTLKKSNSQLYVALNQQEIDESADGNNARPHRRRSFEFENLVRNENPDNLGSDGLGFMKQFGEYGAYFKVMISGLVYLTGVFSLLLYSNVVASKSPTLGFAHTVMPTLLHIIGIGATVGYKVYYDFSPAVGHLEKMHLIIRSRMWLFPGVFGPLVEKKRSILEAQRKVDIPAPHWDDEDEKSGRLTFNVTEFLKRCQFPENRCLFRAWELYPWSQVAKISDLDYADKITNAAQEQIKGVLPVLDVLDGISNLFNLINPLIYVRWGKKLGAYFIGKHSRTMALEDIDEGSGCFATRAEEIEVDDVNRNVKEKDFWQRGEPPQWGTVRLTDFGERFSMLVIKANVLGFCFFVLSVAGYLVMIFGEVHFYSCLDIASREYNSASHDDGKYIEERVDRKNSGSHGDGMDWAEEYADLHSFAPGGVLLMFMVLPFALQSSALMAENAVVPMMVVDTLQAHVTNFTIELDQFLTLLAVNKGCLSSGVVQDHLRHKVAMTREMSLSWRIGEFIKEVEHDCEVINTSVGLMVLNLVCHLIPLNIFVYDTSSCVPLWVILFTVAQGLALLLVIKGGVECNEMINEGIDSLLHNWQLKFNMIGWSGGFIQPGANDKVRGFVCQDPPQETHAKIHEIETKEGNTDYGAVVREAQRSRVDSIVRVLAHYEAENLTPFQVLGVTLTKDIMTLVIGFFGSSIVGLITHVLDDRDSIRAVFMCHGLEY